MTALANANARRLRSELVILRDLVSCENGAIHSNCDTAGKPTDTQSSRRTLHIVSRSFLEASSDTL